VEDSQDDAAKLKLDLRRADFDVQWLRVETAAELREGLMGFKPSVILSDDELPRFSAAAALRMVQESGLDIPFIVLSETAGEDGAVEMLKAGACDYLLKGNLARLGEVIRRELKGVLTRVERDDFDAALRKTQKYLERAQESARLGSWIYTLDGSQPMIWSKETYRILGLKSDGFDGNPETLFSFTHPEDRERVSEARQQAIRGEVAYQLDHRVVLRPLQRRAPHPRAHGGRVCGCRPVAQTRIAFQAGQAFRGPLSCKRRRGGRAHATSQTVVVRFRKASGSPAR